MMDKSLNTHGSMNVIIEINDVLSIPSVIQELMNEFTLSDGIRHILSLVDTSIEHIDHINIIGSMIASNQCSFECVDNVVNCKCNCNCEYETYDLTSEELYMYNAANKNAFIKKEVEAAISAHMPSNLDVVVEVLD